jgi:hypothetical protein
MVILAFGMNEPMVVFQRILGKYHKKISVHLIPSATLNATIFSCCGASAHESTALFSEIPSTACSITKMLAVIIVAAKPNQSFIDTTSRQPRYKIKFSLIVSYNAAFNQKIYAINNHQKEMIVSLMPTSAGTVYVDCW